MLPRCTGTCGAFATKFPNGSNKAHEKSSLSLIFVLAEVYWRVIPIYSAIDINLWPNIESSIGSSGTSSIVLNSLQSLYAFWSIKSISTFPNSSIRASLCGSTRMVDVLFRIIAGPETFIPDFIASRSKTGELKLYAVPLISK